MSSKWWFTAAFALDVVGAFLWVPLIPSAVVVFFVGWYRYGWERSLR